MKLTYDPAHNIAYIAFRDKPEEVETIKISDELNIDMAPDGTVYGIELLNANEQLAGAGGGGGRTMTVINEASGTSTEVKLSA
jgi:uncharacterized protein YuzE